MQSNKLYINLDVSKRYIFSGYVFSNHYVIYFKKQIKGNNRKKRNNKNTELQQKHTKTYIETDSLITTTIFLT